MNDDKYHRSDASHVPLQPENQSRWSSHRVNECTGKAGFRAMPSIDRDNGVNDDEMSRTQNRLFISVNFNSSELLYNFSNSWLKVLSIF